MNALLALCLFAAGFYRPPVPNTAPLPDTGAVWVYFTDKGISTDAAYAAATRATTLSALPEVRERRLREPVRGFDYDDLPIREEYIRAIEALGARHRTTSRWLNAASFELPRPLLPAVRRLPFVHDLRPVVRERRLATDRTFPVSGTAEVRSRAVDSATAHRFYGPSYDQAQMMGIPDLFYRGWYGTGVKLAIFDTGLRLENVAVRDLRIRAQYDFLSGDNFFAAAATADWQPRQADSLRFLGLARDPALALTGDSLLLAFCADSFDYRSVYAPRRAIFSSTNHDPDRGSGWSAPQLIALAARSSQVSFNSFEHLRLADASFAAYLVYGEVSYSHNIGLAGNIWLNYRRDGSWREGLRLGSGRWPDLQVRGERLLAAWVEDDSIVHFRFGAVSDSQPAPGWEFQSRVPAPEPLGGMALAVSDSTVLVVAPARRSDRLYALRSTDLGANWEPARELAPATPTGFHLAARGRAAVLFYKDASVSPFTRLRTMRTPDLGASWTAGPTLTERTLSLGGLAAAWPGPGLDLLYESAGLLHKAHSPDSGLSWQPAVVLDSTGFCYQPAADGLSAAGGSFAAWFKRGDDNAVWEPADTARFSRIQPNHGTRMASIIAGYSPSGIIGVAPGVELLIARTELHLTAGGRDYEYDLEEDTYIQALEWAEAQGADIVSTSLGYRGWYTDEQLDGKTAPISVAASLAARRGLIVVTAMGNRDTTSYPHGRPYIVAPADAEGVVSAGGVQRDGSFWRGTGTGPTADGRCKPELVALSDTVAVARPDTVTGLEGSAGTSCATALIAGAFALLKEAHPDWPAESLKAVMYRTAARSVQSCTFGFGLPRVDEAFRLYPPGTPAEPLPANRIQAFPNPFIPAQHDQVWFQLELARPSSRASIRAYSSSGALVDTFSLNPELLGRPGRYAELPELAEIGARWDGRNSDGRPVAAGLYLAVLHTTYGQAVCRFAVIR